MMPKKHLIAAIIQLSPTANPAFLAEFSRLELRDYYFRLRAALEAGGPADRTLVGAPELQRLARL